MRRTIAVLFLAALPSSAPSPAQAKAVPMDLAWAVDSNRELTVNGSLRTRGASRVALELDRQGARQAGRSVRTKRRSFRLRQQLGNAGRLRFRVRVTRRQAGKWRLRGTSAWRAINATSLPPATPTTTVPPERVVSAPPPGTAGALVLASTPLAEGQFVAFDRGPATPAGLLGRVSAVSVDAAGRTVATLTPAAINEVVPIGGFSVTVRSGDSGTVGRRSALPAPEGSVGGKPFGSGPLSCRGAVAAPGVSQSGVVPAIASARGSLNASVDFGAEWHWGLPPTASAHAIFKPELSADLTIATGEAVSCDLEPQSLTGGLVPLGVVTVPVGAVPLVVSLQGEALLTGSLKGTAGLQAAVSTTLKGTAGVRINEAGRAVTPVGDLEPSFVPTLPRIAFEGSGELGVRAQLTALLDGVTGPAVDVTPSLRLEGGPSREPLWSLSAPVTAGVQWKADLFGLGVLKTESPRYQVFERVIELANSAQGALVGGIECETPAVAEAMSKGHPVGVIVKNLEVSGVTCAAALKQAGRVVVAVKPTGGWSCTGDGIASSPYRCERAGAWFRFEFGGGGM